MCIKQKVMIFLVFMVNLFLAFGQVAFIFIFFHYRYCLQKKYSRWILTDLNFNYLKYHFIILFCVFFLIFPIKPAAAENTFQSLIPTNNSFDPILIGTANMAAWWMPEPFSVYVSGNYAYITNSGNSTLEVFDVSDPTVPKNISMVGTDWFPICVHYMVITHI